MVAALPELYGDEFFTGTEGAATVADVGIVWDVALGGRGYMLDKNPEGGGPGYSFKSMPLLQRYFLTQETGNIGEQTLNPEDYWRRSVDSWVNGAGQQFNDHSTSTRDRFRASKGIDCWTPGQISLLQDTTHILTSANQNLDMVMCGTYLYILDGTALKRTTDGITYTTVTGSGLTSPVSIHSDGYTVWVVDTVNTFFTTRGASTYATWFASPRPGTLIRSVKGRLFVTNLNVIYTSSGAAGSATATALYTHPNPDFAWEDISEGPTAIYFAGFSGDKSIIYQTAVVPDGTNLTIPTAAAYLPSGEIVRAIQGYLGVMMIGTDLGLRVAAIDSQGNLTVGDFIATSTSGVQCFEPHEQFVWFGWAAYDTTSTGLGRVDLGTFNDTAPAYASDLMATAVGDIPSVVTFLGRHAFAVQGSGIWAEDPSNKVASGSISSGDLSYELPDPKIAVKYDIAALAGPGTVDTYLSVDDNVFVKIGGTITTDGSVATHTVQPAGLQTGLVHEIELVLHRDSSDHSEGPVIDRWTLLSNPAPQRRVQIMAWLDLHREVISFSNQSMRIDPRFERNQIDVWLQTNQIITWQDSEQSFAVTVDDYEWRGSNQTDPKVRTWEGSMLVTLKIIT